MSSSVVVSFPAKHKPPARRPARVNAYVAIECAAALEMIAASIRTLNDKLPCAGLPDYAPLLKHLWAQLPTLEAAAALIEDRVEGGL